MSFSHEVKKELFSLTTISKQQNLAELSSIFYFLNIDLNKENITFSENKDMLNRIYLLIEKSNVELNKDNLNIEKYLNKKFYSDILRGAFISCGSILNPENEYHLEFNIHSKEICETLSNMFKFCPTLNYSPPVVNRRNKYVIYLKENEKIIDFLTFIGAQQSAMKFIQIKMLKEVRNNVNRSTNFETANLSKITNSSTEQIKAIKKIQKKIGLNSLPEYLKETAILRLNNPYVSLKELSTFYKNPVSKSGVNHRLKKIVKISSTL